MRPMPIRLGGVPTGVARPPTEAPNDVISIIPMANRAAAGDRAVAVRSGRARRRIARTDDVRRHRQADRIHHRGGRDVADPHGDEAS